MIKVRTEDLTGRTFGRWVVLYRVDDKVLPSGKYHPMWMCECQCDKHTRRIVDGYSLREGGTISCGCYRSEIGYIKNRKYNKFELINDSYYVGYTDNGENFLFDKDDYDRVQDYYWSIDKSHGYVKTNINKKKIYLHQLILQTNHIIDHINNDKTDNRKINLRLASQLQNNRNVGIQKNNKSGVTGVSWNKKRNKWEAFITVNYKKINLGYFEELNDAINARKTAETKYFGEFSYNNSQKLYKELSKIN